MPCIIVIRRKALESGVIHHGCFYVAPGYICCSTCTITLKL